MNGHEKEREKCTKNANKGRKEVSFNEGDLVWVQLRKDRFPHLRKSKLLPREDGPFKIIKKLNDYAYKVDMPHEFGGSMQVPILRKILFKKGRMMHPRDKYGIGFDKKKDLKKDKSTSYCLNYGKFGHMSYSCGDCPKKKPSKHFKTNKKGPKKILVPRNLTIPIVDLLDNKKDTLVMVPRQWLLMSHDKRKIYVPRPNTYVWRLGYL
ncbi:hypothetical protein CR513_29400, partial [Mucuna pruriens]